MGRPPAGRGPQGEAGSEGSSAALPASLPGGVGCARSCLLFPLVYDDPGGHPFIGTREKDYIVRSRAQQVPDESPPRPGVWVRTPRRGVPRRRGRWHPLSSRAPLQTGLSP